MNASRIGGKMKVESAWERSKKENIFSKDKTNVDINIDALKIDMILRDEK